jgi:hypothetical protein
MKNGNNPFKESFAKNNLNQAQGAPSEERLNAIPSGWTTMNDSVLTEIKDYIFKGFQLANSRIVFGEFTMKREMNGNFDDVYIKLNFLNDKLKNLTESANNANDLTNRCLSTYAEYFRELYNKYNLRVDPCLNELYKKVNQGFDDQLNEMKQRVDEKFKELQTFYDGNLNHLFDEAVKKYSDMLAKRCNEIEEKLDKRDAELRAQVLQTVESELGKFKQEQANFMKKPDEKVNKEENKKEKKENIKEKVKVEDKSEKKKKEEVKSRNASKEKKKDRSVSKPKSKKKEDSEDESPVSDDNSFYSRGSEKREEDDRYILRKHSNDNKIVFVKSTKTSNSEMEVSRWSFMKEKSVDKNNYTLITYSIVESFETDTHLDDKIDRWDSKFEKAFDTKTIKMRSINKPSFIYSLEYDRKMIQFKQIPNIDKERKKLGAFYLQRGDSYLYINYAKMLEYKENLEKEQKMKEEEKKKNEKPQYYNNRRYYNNYNNYNRYRGNYNRGGYYNNYRSNNNSLMSKLFYQMKKIGNQMQNIKN